MAIYTADAQILTDEFHTSHSLTSTPTNVAVKNGRERCV